MDFLLAHHRGGDAWLWPTMRRLNPAASDVLAQMDADHEAISQHIGKVTDDGKLRGRAGVGTARCGGIGPRRPFESSGRAIDVTDAAWLTTADRRGYLARTYLLNVCRVIVSGMTRGKVATQHRCLSASRRDSGLIVSSCDATNARTQSGLVRA